MNKTQNKKITISFWMLPLVLAAFAFLSYGIIANKLGVYWDDWAYIWTRLELGYSGLLRHFSFSRPLAGQLHNIAILLTNGDPLMIQIYALLMRVLCSVCVAWLVFTLWNSDCLAASLTALFFIAYPGFSMQPIAINFSFSYFLIGILCLSFIFSILALRKPPRRILFSILALLTGLLNLFATEYFFMLELLRPFILWLEIAKDTAVLSRRMIKTIRAWIPNLIIFLCGTAYRMFFNTTQTLHYDFSLASEFSKNPLHAVQLWLNAMLHDCWKVVGPAWGQVFHFPQMETLGQRTFMLYCVVCLSAAVMIFVYLFLLRNVSLDGTKTGWQMILIGLVSLPLAGQPFWLTGTELSFIFPNSRYTLPFMLGVSLILAGLLSLIRRPRILPVLICAVLCGLSAGYHFDNANLYRRDWTLTRDFFWQLKWRVPAIEENTVLITNVLPIRFSTDNSLTAALNWIYADEYHNETIPFMLYTNTKRENTLSGLSKDQDVFQEYLSAQFFGNTSDAISVYYSAPGCVHVLDPQVDLFNQTIPIIDRDAALLNNYQRIRSDVAFQPLDVTRFGAEPAHGWCWYYENADLARQEKNWQKAASLGDEAFSLSDHPNDPMERIPFIEAYAHVGDWQAALKQTEAAYAVTPVMNNPLCILWDRIELECDEGGEETIEEVRRMLDCDF